MIKKQKRKEIYTIYFYIVRATVSLYVDFCQYIVAKEIRSKLFCHYILTFIDFDRGAPPLSPSVADNVGRATRLYTQRPVKNVRLIYGTYAKYDAWKEQRGLVTQWIKHINY